MEEYGQYFENSFYKQILRFSLPFRNFMPHIKIMKFCQNHWSLMHIDSHYFEKPDPDPHGSEKQDPDPHSFKI